MKLYSKKDWGFAAVAVLLIATLASLAVFLQLPNQSALPQTEQPSPRYLLYRGEESKVYLIEESASYSCAGKTYVSADGVEVPAGSQLFIVHLTLRNDYSSDAPPPAAVDTPVTPIDGTAYVCLNFTLHAGEETVSAVNVTPADFAAPTSDQTGLVLASGQTYSGEFVLATNQTGITQFEANLPFLGDSIPR